MQSLPMRFADRLVGELRQEHGRLELGYRAELGNVAESPAVSRRLPLRAAAYGDAECRPFIANLLPEGAWRGRLCRRLGLSATDDFGLLQKLGHDCAGAVSFDDPSLDAAGDAYTPLPEPELRRWLRDPLVRPSPAEAPGLRRALSGAQDKLVLHLADGEPYLCERGAASTVIIKPDIQGAFDGVELTAQNELFCMQLAAAVGLRVPRSFWYAGAFAVERFDRVLVGSRLERRHQEDFAQLLGVLPAAKYEVGWPSCFEVAERYLPEPEAGKRELVERLLFNLLIGNGDAHCKNFALLLGPSGAELAPAYDLLCTEAYPALSQTYVMPVGPARRQSELSALAWQQLAEQARLPLEWIQQRGTELSAAVELALRELPSQILAHHPVLLSDIYPARRRDDFLRKLVDLMVGNCKRVARTLVGRA